MKKHVHIGTTEDYIFLIKNINMKVKRKNHVLILEKIVQSDVNITKRVNKIIENINKKINLELLRRIVINWRDST